jgi:ankyrin repeat protein
MERIEGQIEDQKRLAKQVLSWITCAKRPLTISELQHALAVEIGESELDEENLSQIEDMVSVCAGLVTVDDESGIIRLVHYTTQEYFERMQKHWFPEAESEITTRCITYLSFHIFKTGFCESDKVFEERLRLNPLYDYAAHNWGVHACNAPTCCQDVIDFLEDTEKVEAASQALMVKKGSWKSQHSQDVPKQVRGIHLAAYFGVQEAVHILIQQGQNVDLNDSYGGTALSYAADRGHGAVVQLLLNNGADTESADRNGRTPLLRAVASRHDGVVRLLLNEGADTESADGNGRTPLLWAVSNGHESIVQLLLDKDADTESKDKDGWTPLLWAVASRHEAVVQLLLNKGADTESADRNGRTPLLWAVASRYDGIIQLLLNNGADTESAEGNGRTPLLWAVANGHESIVQLLLDKDADTESKDKRGWAPLLWAVASRHEAVVQFLLNKGADTESADRNGRTPLLWAVVNRHEGIIQLLLNNGADTESADGNGWTPLSWAIMNGHEGIVQLLLGNGVNVESINRYGETPLPSAADYKLGCPHITELISADGPMLRAQLLLLKMDKLSILEQMLNQVDHQEKFLEKSPSVGNTTRIFFLSQIDFFLADYGIPRDQTNNNTDANGR